MKRLGVSIEKRPQKINPPHRPFYWEGDLVKGGRRKNQPALMTLTERLTRFEIVIKIPNYRAETCRQELQKVINYHPNWFNSEVFLTTSVVVDGNWYDGDEGTARLTDNDGLAAIQTVVF